MIIFTQTRLTLGNSEIPEGAYSLYVIPEKQNWTLVVNRNVTAGSKCRREARPGAGTYTNWGNRQPCKTASDLVRPHSRETMQHAVVIETTGAWVEFQEK